MPCCDLPVQVLVVDLLRVWYKVPSEDVEYCSEILYTGQHPFGVFTGRVYGAVDPFNFHGGIEGFGESVVETHVLARV